MEVTPAEEAEPPRDPAGACAREMPAHWLFPVQTLCIYLLRGHLQARGPEFRSQNPHNEPGVVTLICNLSAGDMRIPWACLPASLGKSKTSVKDPVFYHHHDDDDDDFNCVYMCVSKNRYVDMGEGIHRTQQRASDPL